MNKVLTFLTFIVMGITANAQTASAVWPLTSITTTAVAATGNITGQNEFFTGMAINNYTGPNSSQRVTTGDGSWPAETEQNENRYIQFAVSPAQGNNLNVTAISMQLGASGGSNMRANIFYSLSQDFSNPVQLNQSVIVLPSGAFVSPAPNYITDVQVYEGETLYLRIYPWYTTASTGKYVCPQDVRIYGTTTPGTMIDVSVSSLSNFGTIIPGGHSASAEYFVSGSNLSQNIILTAPDNFEISKDNALFSNSLELVQSGGLVSSTKIYARFSPASANGINSGFISHSTINAETKNVSVNGIAITSEPLVSSYISFGAVTGNTLEVNLTEGSGSNRILVIRPSNSVNWHPEDGSQYAGVSSDYLLAADQGDGNKVLYDGAGNFVKVTGLSGFTTYYFTVYEYNVEYGNSQNYLTSSPGTGIQTTPAAPVIVTSVSKISFGNIEANTLSAVQSYTVSANTLSPQSGNITVSAPEGFEISLNSTSGFSSSIQIPYTDNKLSQTAVYARFNPSEIKSYSANIVHTGGSANVQNLSVSGTGIGPHIPNVFEAENGILNRAEARNEYSGYSGSGYIYLVNRAGAWVDFLFKRESATTDTITIYFSNGSGSVRSLSVSINESVIGNLSFPNTSAWSNWSSVKYVVAFQQGLNRLRLSTIGTSTNPFIDKVFIHGENALPVYRLKLLASGSGTFNLSSSESYYDLGSEVTISGNPSGGNIFTRWFGDVEETQNPLPLIMSSHKTVVGVFMPSNSLTDFPYEQKSRGFASVNALGNIGTTGGANGITAIVSTGAELWNLMLDRQDANNVKNLKPLTVYISGILSPDPALFGSSKMLDIKDTYDITLIGIGSNATITGFGLKIFRAKNIIVRNIKFASCPDDGISIDANDDAQLGHHIWIDHCTFTQVPPPGYPTFSNYDGALDITHTASYVTVSWNLFENQDKNSLIGHSDSNTSDADMKITYHHNWFKGTVQRNPRVRFAKVHVYNNYYTNNVLYGISSNMEADVMVEGNYFLNVPIPTETSRDGSPPGDVVERDNRFINCGTPGIRGAAFEPSLFYSYSLDSAEAVPDLVMKYAGSGKYDFSLGGQDPIPVELLAFNAHVNGTAVLLSWTTATELNNYGWEIERNSEGNVWEKIGFIPGNGSSLNKNFYSFEDNSSKTNGIYSYRLRQLDYDGAFNLSAAVEAEINQVLSYFLHQNYPNPFNPSTAIRFEIPENSSVNLSIYNLLGEKVAVLLDESLEAGVYSRTFDAANLASGIYLYVLKTDSYLSTKKMILLK